MDTFIYDPKTNDGKIVASVKQGSLKVISGLISQKDPDSLTVTVPEGTLGSRGTEFQTIVSKGKTDTLLIGPGKNNTLGMRPGAVLVGNSLGSTLLDNPYSMASMTKGKAPGQAKKITKNQLKKFNKKMKALRVAKLSPDEKKGKRKEMKKQLKKELLDYVWQYGPKIKEDYHSFVAPLLDLAPRPFFEFLNCACKISFQYKNFKNLSLSESILYSLSNIPFLYINETPKPSIFGSATKSTSELFSHFLMRL